jgi:hypothetical protein
VRSPSSATVRTHTFATLTEQQARPLLAKRARFVQLDSPETDLDGFDCFECRSANDAERSVRFMPAEQIGEDEVDVLIEDRLVVFRLQAYQGYRNARRIGWWRLFWLGGGGAVLYDGLDPSNGKRSEKDDGQRGDDHQERECAALPAAVDAST